MCFLLLQWKAKFLSTCPVRGTTVRSGSRRAFAYISIHVPREGHDYIGF